MRISGPIHVDRGRLSSGLSAALSLCGKVQESGDDRDVLDFSGIPFVTPTLVLPLFVYLNGVRKSVEFENVTEYMRRIGFGSPEREGYLDLPHDIHINGTIIAFRIPFNKRDFRYIEYVE